MAAIGRVVLIAAALVAPWIFGSVQAWPQFCLAGVVTLLMACRLLESLADRSEPPILIPLASIAPLALLLIAAIQLLPRAETRTSQMDHAVFAEDAGLAAGPEFAATGTLCAASTRREAARLYFALGAFLLAAHWFCTQDSFRVLAGALTLNGVALGIFGIIQRLSWNGKLFWTVDLRFGGTPFASYVNRNNAAGYLNLTLAAAIGFTMLLWSARGGGVLPSWNASTSRLRLRFWDRWKLAMAGLEAQHLAAVGGLAVLVASVLFSLSRGGILAMACSALVIFLKARHGIHRWAFLALAGVVAVAAGALLVVSGGLRTVDDRIATLSDPLTAASGRLQHWQDTLGAVQDFPVLGTGLGTYRFANQPYQTEPAHAWYYNADNEWFEVLVEAGAVGLTAMVSGFVLISVSSWYLLKQGDPRWRAIGAVGLFTVSSQCIQALTDFGMIVPANGLTLAVIAGAVCGAAGRAAAFHQLRVPMALSIAQLESKVSRAAWGGVLTLAGVAFLLELFVATKAQAVRDARVPLDVEPIRVQATLNTIDASLAEANRVVKYRPDDAELHADIGRWLVDRYRLQMFEELISEIPDPQPAQRQELWKAAALPSLSLRARQFRAAGQQAELDRFLHLPAVTENLVAAQKHFETSYRHCPLGRNVSLALARLAFLNGDSKISVTGELIQRTRFTSPSTPSVLIETGMLAAVSGETAVAEECWNRALKLSPESALTVWRLAVEVFSPEDVMDRILPSGAEVLLGIAEQVDEPDVQKLLSKRAESWLEQQSGGDSADGLEILYARLAELQSQPSLAIRHYQLALSDNPWEIDWRLRLARLLRRQGRLSEADAEYSLLSHQAPERRDIQGERRSLRLELLEQRVRPRPNVDQP